MRNLSLDSSALRSFPVVRLRNRGSVDDSPRAMSPSSIYEIAMTLSDLSSTNPIDNEEAAVSLGFHDCGECVVKLSYLDGRALEGLLRLIFRPIDQLCCLRLVQCLLPI